MSSTAFSSTPGLLGSPCSSIYIGNVYASSINVPSATSATGYVNLTGFSLSGPVGGNAAGCVVDTSSSQQINCLKVWDCDTVHSSDVNVGNPQNIATNALNSGLALQTNAVFNKSPAGAPSNNVSFVCPTTFNGRVIFNGNTTFASTPGSGMTGINYVIIPYTYVPFNSAGSGFNFFNGLYIGLKYNSGYGGLVQILSSSVVDLDLGYGTCLATQNIPSVFSLNLVLSSFKNQFQNYDSVTSLPINFTANCGVLSAWYHVKAVTNTNAYLVLPDPCAALAGMSVTFVRVGGNLTSGNSVTLINATPGVFNSANGQSNAFLTTAGNCIPSVTLGYVGIGATSGAYWVKSGFVCIANYDDAKSSTANPCYCWNQFLYQ